MGAIDIHTFENENVVSWTDTRTFEGEKVSNLHFAAVLTSFSSNAANEKLTPDIGELKAYKKRWGSERPKNESMFAEQPLKPCNLSDSLMNEYLENGD